MSLSKNFTLQQVESIVRVLANEIAPDKVQSLTIKDYVNIATFDVAEMLNGAKYPDYGVIATGSITGWTTLVGGAAVNGSISIAGINYDKIVKITDSVAGLVVLQKDLVFENVANILAYNNSMFYNHFGESLLFFKGSTQAPATGSVSIYYYRLPTPVANQADFVDVKDKYMPLVIAKVKALVYEQVGQTPPEALTTQIESQSMAIRQVNMEEMALLKDRARGTPTKQ
jgi:hypothetical protein